LDSKCDCEIKLIKNISNIASIRRESSTKTIAAWLSENDWKTAFSNFNKALTQLVTIIVISWPCNQAYSKLSNVKSKLSTMLQESLDSLMLILILFYQLIILY
jgi:hypothetical protein